MSDFKNEELARQFPVKAACIQSLATFSSLYDANAIVLERLSTTDRDIALWTVSVPARDTNKVNLFGVVLDSKQQMIPINRAFCADKEQFQSLIDVCTNPETVSIVERITTAAEEYEFGPVSGPDVLLGFDRDWKGQRPRNFDFLLLDRRSRDRAAGESVRIAARNWEPSFFRGDSEAVTQEAFARLTRRRERYGWTRLGIEDPETAAELTVLTDFLKEHVPDFEVAQLDHHGSAKAGKVVYSRKILPFYKHHRLYEIFDHRHARPRRTRFLFSPDAGRDTDRLIPLAGIVVPIPNLTEKNDRGFEADELVEYVAFHCDHVAGKNGNPFFVVETTEDLSWRTHQHGSQIQNLLAPSIFPLRLWPEPAPVQTEQDEIEGEPQGQTAARTRLVDGFARYDAGFSHVVYSVQPDGKIDMIEDDHILRALPARLSLLDFDNQFLLKQSVR
jgi:hypothetical protein